MTTPSVSPALQVPSSIDYTSKDFTAFVQSMVAYAGQVMPDWDASSEGDAGVALLELFAYPLDILSFYGDQISQEAYLPTATQRASLLNIAALLGYTVSNGTAATGTVTFATANPGAAVTIPAATQVATSFQVSLDQPVVYETNEVITCPGNGGTVTAGVTQGVTYTQTAIGTSDGLAGQTYSIPQTGVIDGTVKVYVQTSTNQPQQWQQVTYLTEAGADAPAYQVSTDADGLTWVSFGDGLTGMIPGQGLIVYATYRVGVGSAGNVAAGIVGEIVNPLDGLVIPFLSDGQTFESSQMSGGSDPETNEQIRANAPRVFATQQRAVSPGDFEAIAVNVQGVSAANAVARHSTSVTVYALGPDYQPAAPGLQSQILGAFTGRTLAGVSVTCAQPALIPVDVGSAADPVTLQVLDSYLQTAVVQNVQTALTAFLQPPNVAFGELLAIGQLYELVMAVAGVDWCVIPVMTREDVTQAGTASIQFRDSEVPCPGQFFITPSGGF